MPSLSSHQAPLEKTCKSKSRIPGMIFGIQHHLMRGSMQCSIHVSWLGNVHLKYCGIGGIFRISMLAESLLQVSFTGIVVKPKTLKIYESAILCKNAPNRCFLQAISGNVCLWSAGPGLWCRFCPHQEGLKGHVSDMRWRPRRRCLRHWWPDLGAKRSLVQLEEVHICLTCDIHMKENSLRALRTLALSRSDLDTSALWQKRFQRNKIWPPNHCWEMEWHILIWPISVSPKSVIWRMRP